MTESGGAERGDRGPGNGRLATLTVAVIVLSAMLSGWARRGFGPDRAAEDPRERVESASIGPGRGADDRLLERGALAYRVRCARCHGEEGRGDGPDAATIAPPPRDLAGPWAFGKTPEGARRAIVEGVPGTAMAGIGHSVGLAEREGLVAFVLEIGTRRGSDPALRAAMRDAGFEPVADPKAAPALSVVAADGGSRSLAELRGQWVLVHFWGTSCAPCLKELPALGALSRTAGGRGPEILAICADNLDVGEADACLDRLAPGLEALVDPSGLAPVRYNATTLPTTALVDPRGRLVGRVSGTLDWSSGALAALLDAFQGVPRGAKDADGS